MPRHSPCALISLTIWIMLPLAELISFIWNCSFFTRLKIIFLVVLKNFCFPHLHLLSLFNFQDTIELASKFILNTLLRWINSLICLRKPQTISLFAIQSNCLVGTMWTSPLVKNKFSFDILLTFSYCDYSQYGGHKWTRTTDLTLIRRAL